MALVGERVLDTPILSSTLETVPEAEFRLEEIRLLPDERLRFLLWADEDDFPERETAVASATGRRATGTGARPETLDPLAESIDPEALDRILEPLGTGREAVAVVEFEYCGHAVTVEGGETVCVTVQ
jgi:hypothetical protein